MKTKEMKTSDIIDKIQEIADSCGDAEIENAIEKIKSGEMMQGVEMILELSPNTHHGDLCHVSNFICCTLFEKNMADLGDLASRLQAA